MIILIIIIIIIMAASEGLKLCALLWIITITNGKESIVMCTDSEECVLPCEFPSDGKGARVMWYKKKAVVSCTRYGDTSFVVGHNTPSQSYRGRTGLYADQVLQGNATLLLRHVTPHDEGKYFCITYTSSRTDESGVISLKVKVPVREVDIELDGDTITCRSSGIYPAPKLSWSTLPPTGVQTLQNISRTQKNQQGFYDIQSTQRLLGNDTTNITYVCSVTSDSNKKTANLKLQAHILAYTGSAVMIPCSFPHSDLHSFNLTWMFNRVEPILTMNVTRQTPQVKVWDQWKDHISESLLASSGLQVHHLLLQQQGTYMCEVSTMEEVYITQTDVVFSGDSYEVYIYITVIVILSYFLLVSYGTLAIFGFELKKEEERTNARAEPLNINGVNSAVEIQE